jgi:multidrug efflux pump subunit AcrA (membrane-fusion protein)
MISASVWRPAAVLAAIGLAVLPLGGCAKAQQKKPQPGLPVSTIAAKRGDITATFTLTGTVAPRQQATLSSVVSGNVQQVYVSLGEFVHAGQMLVKIDDSTLQAQAAQASAHLASVKANNMGGTSTAQANLESARVANDNAQSNLRRNQELFKQGYVSQSAIDQAQNQASAALAAYRAAQVTAQNANMSAGSNSSALADIANAQAALTAIQTQIAQTNVTAPFDGVITARSVDAGSLASPGTALVTVSQLDPAWINVGIPDDDLAYVHNGTLVDITVDTLPGRIWHAHVNVVNGAASTGTLSFLTHIVVPNSDGALRGGMVANVRFTQAVHRNVIVIPRVALYQSGSGYALYVVDQGKAKSVPVKVGLETQDAAEVSGIEPGAQVITQRPDALQDGSVVSVVSGAQEGPSPSSSQTSQ